MTALARSGRLESNAKRKSWIRSTESRLPASEPPKLVYGVFMTIRAKVEAEGAPGAKGAETATATETREVSMTDQALTPSPLPQGLMTRKPLADIIAEGE